MALSLADMKQRRADKPPRVVIYGPPGMGKTTLASEFPNPVFLQTEDGVPAGLEVVSFGHLRTYEAVMGAIMALYNEEHDRKTLVLDSLSEMEKLVWAETCRANNWKSIEDPGYGKGYVAAEYVWQQLVEGLNALRRDRGMAIVLIAHSETPRFDDPTAQSYTRYDIDLHKGGKALIDREVDAILLIKQEVSVQKEDQGFNKKRNIGVGAARFIYCQPSAAFNAKNRHNMPEKLLFEPGKGYAALAPYFGNQPQPAGEPAQAA